MERQNTFTTPMPRSPSKRPKTSEIPEVINARRTESLDAPDILKLVQPSTESLFGRVNIVNLIEKASLAITLCNEKDDILGHAAVYDYPNTCGIDSANWEDWLYKFYDLEKCTALNTVFLHYFVSKQDYSHGCAEEIVRTMFNAVPSIHYCILNVPIGVYPDAALSNLFEEVKMKEGLQKGPDNCAVFICYRHKHVPVLHIRKAKVEDHDDLTPIFNRQTDVLKKTYGDFFLAELIDGQDDKLVCLVAEVDGTAVGFMSVSEDVNVKMLNECFELGPYHGFCKKHEDDIIVEKKSVDDDDDDIKQYQIDAFSREKSKLSKKSTNTEKSAASVRESVKIRRRMTDDLLVDDDDEEENLAVDDNKSNSDNSISRSESSNSLKSGPGKVVRQKTMQLSTPKVTPKKRCIPTYAGENLAICIQLFCMDERFEMRSTDFMYKIFEYFPAKEFCVITVPHMVPEFPLLQQCSRIIPRAHSSVLPQELNLNIKHCVTENLSAIEQFINDLKLKSSILKDIKQYTIAHRDEDGTKLGAYMATINNNPIGLIVIRSEHNIEFIRSHYNIEDFIYFNHHSRREHVRINHFVVNPAFKHLSKHILKEVFRLFRVTCAYYYIYPPFMGKNKESEFSLLGVMSDFVPVRARRQIDYNLEILKDNAPSERILEEKIPCGLIHLNRKLMLEPKVTINARIVVIGASDMSLSFLESVIYCPHLKFNNLTIISPHGLPGELEEDNLRDNFLASSGCYTQNDHSRMSLRSWCNVVYGKMTKIDRHKKFVWVNEQFVVPYDHLIIGCGCQFQVPAPNGANVDNLATTEEAEFDSERRWEGKVPVNLFTVNDFYESAAALYWIDNYFLNGVKEGNIVVYGLHLNSFTCINSLLDLGVEADKIHLVLPPLDSQVPNCFNNDVIEKKVFSELKQQGISVHHGYSLAQWNECCTEIDEIKTVSFSSSRKPLKLEVAVFFAFHRQDVDYEAFRSLNDACLVYDGRLVIDATFHTNDCTIRAAGPITKFQRVFHADDLTHAEFNSKQIGVQLANTFLTLFDPTLEAESEPVENGLKLVPIYKQPKITLAYLPGGLYYLRLRKSGIESLLAIAETQNDYGRAVKTGSVEDGNLFLIHCNQYGTIETITCLSRDFIKTENIMCLYGLHERLLNNLLSRYDGGLISDFYSYFDESWAVAIFHDRFSDLRDEIRELLCTRPKIDVESIEERVRILLDEDEQSLGPKQRSSLLNDMEKNGTKRAVETRLLAFFSYNQYHLPMYARPGIL